MMMKMVMTTMMTIMIMMTVTTKQQHYFAETFPLFSIPLQTFSYRICPLLPLCLFELGHTAVSLIFLDCITHEVTVVLVGLQHI
jgi:hypothetical protein